MACGDCDISSNTKRFFILLSLLGIYLLAGAAVFQALENEQEAQEIVDLNKVKAYMMTRHNLTTWEFDVFVKKVERALKHRCHENNNDWCSSKWTYYASLYFTVSVVTTIGYGHLAPTTDGGRLFCMMFALFGIPMNMMIMQHVGRTITGYIHSLLRYLDRRFFNREIKRLKIKTLLVTVVLMISALLIGGMMYTLTEEWTYLEGVYYCFITFSTIGFGDLVPNQGMAPESQYESLIEVARAVLVILGLSLLFSVISSVLIASDELRITFPKLIGKDSGYEPISPGEKQNVILSDDDSDNGPAHDTQQREEQESEHGCSAKPNSNYQNNALNSEHLYPPLNNSLSQSGTNNPTTQSGANSPVSRSRTTSPKREYAPSKDQNDFEKYNLSLSQGSNTLSSTTANDPDQGAAQYYENTSLSSASTSRNPSPDSTDSPLKESPSNLRYALAGFSIEGKSKSPELALRNKIFELQAERVSSKHSNGDDCHRENSKNYYAPVNESTHCKLSLSNLEPAEEIRNKLITDNISLYSQNEDFLKTGKLLQTHSPGEKANEVIENNIKQSPLENEDFKEASIKGKSIKNITDTLCCKDGVTNEKNNKRNSSISPELFTPDLQTIFGYTTNPNELPKNSPVIEENLTLNLRDKNISDNKTNSKQLINDKRHTSDRPTDRAEERK